MTIPSSAAVHEIMLYEGFNPRPVLNKVGMPCIGYGFPLWEEALAVLHGNTALAKCIKTALPGEQENISLGIRRLLALPCTVSRQKAKELLEQSLLYYADELGKKHAGFRRLVNLCGNSCILPQSSLARYEAHLKVFLRQEEQRQNEAFPKKAAAKKKHKRGSADTAEAYAAESGKTVPNSADSSFFAGQGSVHPAFLASAGTSSGDFSVLAAQGGMLRRYPRRKKENSYYLPLTKEEQALLRVDAVLFLTHILGLELTGQMDGFFWALKEENYALAASELLAHSAAARLGAVMHMLARRIRDASLDLRDISAKDREAVKFVLHRGKKHSAANYMAEFLQKQKRSFGKRIDTGRMRHSALPFSGAVNG